MTNCARLWHFAQPSVVNLFSAPKTAGLAKSKFISPSFNPTRRACSISTSPCFIERQFVNASRIQSPTHILQIPHQMRFYNNRCKVPPIVPPNPASQNAIFGFYITPLCSTFMNTLNQSVAFKQNKSICWGRGETPSSPPMRRDFFQILDFKFFGRAGLNGRAV